ncbi:hypothetical protein E4T44_03527 [Aureobasidium sp. EXF-8845]|nr:hypothetical protein E4T44_03527 [Aureobasidium sp. EXF-8845]KAI4854326.1 hypothetical protein E4T45_04003 [Aureobasidium sp. EXF-8846]
MIRHIYDLPYAGDDMRTSKEHLVFCMNVFIVADKYDIASLREKVVPDFSDYAQLGWESKEFVECVEKLCGPDAILLADPTLQAAVATFFINNILVKIIKGDKSFTGLVLAGMLESDSGSTRYLGVCYKPNKSNRAMPDCTHVNEKDSNYLAATSERCVHCGETGGEVYNKSGGGTAESTISPRFKVILM